jgi:hypothetical protein
VLVVVAAQVYVSRLASALAALSAVRVIFLVVIAVLATDLLSSIPTTPPTHGARSAGLDALHRFSQDVASSQDALTYAMATYDRNAGRLLHMELCPQSACARCERWLCERPQ